MSSINGTHIVHSLIERLRDLGDYPVGVKEIHERIRYTAFFPGGYGLWNPEGDLPLLPQRPIVIVGNNWGDVDSHRAVLRDGMEYSDDWKDSRKRKNPTWHTLVRILRRSDVPLQHCFFTNAFMGLKNDGKGCMGAFPITPDFAVLCREFLKFQLQALQPSVILVLGKPAIKALSDPDLTHGLCRWRGPRGGERTIKEIYLQEHGVIQAVRVDERTPPCVAVALNHPCYPSNLSKEFLQEIALVRQAVALALGTAPS